MKKYLALAALLFAVIAAFSPVPGPSSISVASRSLSGFHIYGESTLNVSREPRTPDELDTLRINDPAGWEGVVRIYQKRREINPVDGLAFAFWGDTTVYGDPDMVLELTNKNWLTWTWERFTSP